MLKLGFAVVFYRSELNGNEDLNDKMNGKVGENETRLIMAFLRQHDAISTAQAEQVIRKSPASSQCGMKLGIVELQFR